MTDYRPRYHIHPPVNWMNNPNGAIQHKGSYHLFYQYNPYGTFSKHKHWAHITSRDLVHWKQLPIALAPTPDGYDKDGCFSGFAVINQDTPTILYTGVQPEVQCLATSDSTMLDWRKHPANPVIAGPPPGLKVVGFRDPYAWQETDGSWSMLIGSGIRGEGGTCLVYSSLDLIQWVYRGQLYTGQEKESGQTWNCPSFFPLAGQHVLIVSGQPIWKPFVLTGAYSDYRFVPQASSLADYGGCLYAPQVFRAEDGRMILWGWMWETRPEVEVREAGWAGVMALPRVLSLNPDGTLHSQPAAEVDSLRGSHRALEAFELLPGIRLLDGIQGGSLELTVRLQGCAAETFGLHLFCAPDGSEYAEVGYHRGRRELYIDRSHACTSPKIIFDWPNPTYHAAPVALTEGDLLELRVYLDQSVIEVYGNDGICISTRVYPQDPEQSVVRLFATGSSCRLLSLDCWQMHPAGIIRPGA